MNLASIFSQYGASLFILLKMSFKWKFEILTKSNYQSFSFMDCALVSMENFVQSTKTKIFSYSSCQVLIVIFKSMIYFELICVYDMRNWSSFIVCKWMSNCSGTTVEISLFPLSWLVTWVKNQLIIYVWSISLDSFSAIYVYPVFNSRMSWLLWIYIKFWS